MTIRQALILYARSCNYHIEEYYLDGTMIGYELILSGAEGQRRFLFMAPDKELAPMYVNLYPIREGRLPREAAMRLSFEIAERYSPVHLILNRDGNSFGLCMSSLVNADTAPVFLAQAISLLSEVLNYEHPRIFAALVEGEVGWKKASTLLS